MIKKYVYDLNRLETDMYTYYETDYETDSDDYAENYRIKSEAIKLLREAKSHLGEEEYNSFKSKVRRYLSSNTVRIEDIEIL